MKWVLLIIGVVTALVMLATIIGLLMPTDHVASSSATIPATPNEVYAVITDVRRQPEWRKDLTAVDLMSSTPLRWSETSRFGTITFEQVDAQPPSHFESRIADTTLGFGGSWSYDITADEGGSRVMITERGSVYNPLFRFMSRAVFGHYGTQHSYLRALGQRFGADVKPTRT